MHFVVVDPVKRGVLTLVGETRYRNDRYRYSYSYCYYYPSPPDTPMARRITWDGRRTARCLAVNETDQDDDKKTTSVFPN